MQRHRRHAPEHTDGAGDIRRQRARDGLRQARRPSNCTTQSACEPHTSPGDARTINGHGAGRRGDLLLEQLAHARAAVEDAQRGVAGEAELEVALGGGRRGRDAALVGLGVREGRLRRRRRRRRRGARDVHARVDREARALRGGERVAQDLRDPLEVLCAWLVGGIVGGEGWAYRARGRTRGRRRAARWTCQDALCCASGVSACTCRATRATHWTRLSRSGSVYDTPEPPAQRVDEHLHRDVPLSSKLTRDEDRSRERREIRRAAIWTVHERGDRASAVRRRVLPQTTGEPCAPADKEHDVLVLALVLPVERVRDARDRERVRLRREAAHGRQEHVRVLAGRPAEAAAQREADRVRRDQLDGRGRVLPRLRRADAVVPQQAARAQHPVERPHDERGPDVVPEAAGGRSVPAARVDHMAHVPRVTRVDEP